MGLRVSLRVSLSLSLSLFTGQASGWMISVQTLFRKLGSWEMTIKVVFGIDRKYSESHSTDCLSSQVAYVCLCGAFKSLRKVDPFAWYHVPVFLEGNIRTCFGWLEFEGNTKGSQPFVGVPLFWDASICFQEHCWMTVDTPSMPDAGRAGSNQAMWVFSKVDTNSSRWRVSCWFPLQTIQKQHGPLCWDKPIR